MLVGGMAIDVTERMQAEQELRRHKERLELAQHAGRIGTFEWNVQTDDVELSAGEEELLGLRVGSFAGQLADWLQAVHPDDRERTMADCRRAIAERTPLDAEFRIIRPDGQIRCIAAQGSVKCDELGQAVRMVGVMSMSRKDAKLKLRYATRTGAKTSSWRSCRHELRNPLAPLRSGLEVLRLNGSTSRDVQSIRDMMDRQLTHMVRLIDDLLDVSRISRNKLEVAPHCALPSLTSSTARWKLFAPPSSPRDTH